jgi:thiol:disulfide interchange protein DsbD
MEIRTLLLLFALASLAGCKKDQRLSSPNPAEWRVTAVSGLLEPGSTDTIRFAATLDSGWYIYSLTQKAGGPTPMSVTLDPSPPFTLVGDVIGPRPVTIYDKEFNIETERYVGRPAFEAIVRVADGATPSPTVNVKVRYQACNETFCLPARTTTLTTPMKVAKGT